MKDSSPNPYLHVQRALQASHALWTEQLFSSVDFRVTWSTELIKRLIVLGGADIQYLESELINDDDGSQATIRAFTQRRVIQLDSAISRGPDGTVVPDTRAATFSQASLQSIRLVDVTGTFGSNVALDAIRVIAHYPGLEVELGPEPARAGGAQQYQADQLLRLWPSLLKDLEG